MQTDSKISEGLYKKLGEDTNLLKKRIANNISRGIAQGSGYAVIAKTIAGGMIGYNPINPGGAFARAMRITRTEGNRIANTAHMNAQKKAIEKGANIVKQWDATLDARTRSSHAKVDGEIREYDEKFSNGLLFPSDPNGSAEEVINCRCTVLQRAKWALDEEELQILQDRAKYFGLDKTDNFEDFKKKYLKAVDNSGESGIMNSRNTLYTKDDPMREVLGSAFSSHPNETNKIIDELTQKGVKIIYRDGVMAYQPNPISGKPGQIVIDKNASYSALKHEERHALDDEKSGWQGFKNFLEVKTAIKFEVDAYDIEIEMARNLDLPDMVERLEKLKISRRRELLGE